MTEPFDLHALIDVSKCPEPLQQEIHKLVMEYFEVKPLTSSIIVEGDSRMKWPPLGPNATAEDIANRAAVMAGVPPVFPDAHCAADARHLNEDGAKLYALSVLQYIEANPVPEDGAYDEGTPEHDAYLQGLSEGAESEFNAGVFLAGEKISEWLMANGFADAAAALDASDVTDVIVYKPANHSAPVVEE